MKANLLFSTLTVLVIFGFCLFPCNSYANVYYDIDFSSPPHTVGQPPITGIPVTTPSAIVFGQPIVYQSFDALQDQPLVFNSLGNSSPFYYDQIRLNMNDGTGSYYISFDVVTQNLIGSTNQFVILFDSPGASRIVLQNNGVCSLINRPYQDGELLHFEIFLDYAQKWITVYVNGIKYCDTSYGVSYFRSIRFSLGLVSSISSPDHTTNVGVDNIFVADSYEEPTSCEPIAHWKLDETSGTTAYDSADGYDGTVNGPVWTAGQIDGALQFDGVNSYVNFGDIDAFEFGNNDFSVAFWFYTKGIHDTGPGNDGSHNAAIVTKYNLSTGRQWFIGQAADGTINFSTFHIDGYPSCRIVSTESYFGQWVHVACTKQGSQMYLYVDGSLDANGPSLGTITGRSTNVLVGAIQSSPTHYYQRFNGLIDDIRIYDCALDANQIEELYMAGVNLLSIEIAGPNEVLEESDTQYQVIGHYDNNSTSDITDDANLAINSDEFAVIDANGLLSTDRLYRMQETCTIYADYRGFTADKPVTIYPVCDGNECTEQQLLKRNIADTIEIKQLVREDLAYAMKIERASVQILSQIPKNGKPGQLNKARLQLLAALTWEQWANKRIDESIGRLETVQDILK